MTLVTDDNVDRKEYPSQDIVIDADVGLVRGPPIQYVRNPSYNKKPALFIWGGKNQTKDQFDETLDALIKGQNFESLKSLLESSEEYCVMVTENADNLRKKLG